MQEKQGRTLARGLGFKEPWLCIKRSSNKCTCTHIMFNKVLILCIIGCPALNISSINQLLALLSLDKRFLLLIVLTSQSGCED